MDMQRITVTIPKYLYEDIARQIPAGSVSRFVVKAVEKELMELGEDPVEAFIDLRRKLPKKTRPKIILAIKKGRK